MRIAKPTKTPTDTPTNTTNNVGSTMASRGWKYTLLGGFLVAMCLDILVGHSIPNLLQQSVGEAIRKDYTISTNGSPKPSAETTNLEQLSSARYKIGSWIGNTWIPPPTWKLYSAKEVLKLYQNKTILVIGDSTARRAFVTFYGVLEGAAASYATATATATTSQDENATTARPNSAGSEDVHVPLSLVDDLDRLNIQHPSQAEAQHCPQMPKCEGWHPRLCPTMPGNGTGRLLLVEPVYCLLQMSWWADTEAKLFQENQNMTNNKLHNLVSNGIELIIVSVGAWEEGNKDACLKKNPNATIEEKVSNFVASLEAYQTITNKTVVVRTSGFFDGEAIRSDTKLVERMNQQVMDHIDRFRHNDSTRRPALTYVNWGAAVAPRSHGKDRIQGDHVAHYGIEPRLALWQMLTNHLHDVHFF